MYKKHTNITAYGVICLALWTFTACASEDTGEAAEKIQAVLEIQDGGYAGPVSDFNEEVFGGSQGTGLGEAQRKYARTTNRCRAGLGALCVAAGAARLCTEFLHVKEGQETNGVPNYIPFAAATGFTGLMSLYASCKSYSSRLTSPEMARRARNTAIAFGSLFAGAGLSTAASLVPEYSCELNMTGGSLMGASGAYLLAPAAKSLVTGTWTLLKSCKGARGDK